MTPVVWCRGVNGPKGIPTEGPPTLQKGGPDSHKPQPKPPGLTVEVLTVHREDALPEGGGGGHIEGEPQG